MGVEKSRPIACCTAHRVIPSLPFGILSPVRNRASAAYMESRIPVPCKIAHLVGCEIAHPQSERNRPSSSIRNRSSTARKKSHISVPFESAHPRPVRNLVFLSRATKASSRPLWKHILLDTLRRVMVHRSAELVVLSRESMSLELRW